MGRAGMGVWRAARCVAAAHCEHYTRMRGPMFPRTMHHRLTETITPAPLIRQVQTGNDLYYHNVMQTICNITLGKLSTTSPPVIIIPMVVIAVN